MKKKFSKDSNSFAVVVFSFAPAEDLLGGGLPAVVLAGQGAEEDGLAGGGDPQPVWKRVS